MTSPNRRLLAILAFCFVHTGLVSAGRLDKLNIYYLAIAIYTADGQWPQHGEMGIAIAILNSYSSCDIILLMFIAIMLST